MTIQKDEHYLVSDLKLQGFLRLMLPESFIGVNKTNINRVNFVFKKSKELSEFVSGYLSRKQYLISPLAFAENIEQGKALIHGDY
jgi:hypothetical protein